MPVLYHTSSVSEIFLLIRGTKWSFWVRPFYISLIVVSFENVFELLLLGRMYVLIAKESICFELNLWNIGISVFSISVFELIAYKDYGKSWKRLLFFFMIFLQRRSLISPFFSEICEQAQTGAFCLCLS